MTTIDWVIEEVFGRNHEFWKQNTEDVFRDAAGVLVEAGLGAPETADLLGSLYGAVADEYGG
jgi:hypothetical protein